MEWLKPLVCFLSGAQGVESRGSADVMLLRASRVFNGENTTIRLIKITTNAKLVLAHTGYAYIPASRGSIRLWTLLLVPYCISTVNRVGVFTEHAAVP